MVSPANPVLWVVERGRAVVCGRPLCHAVRKDVTRMTWLCWVLVGICAFDTLFFGTLALIDRIEKRKENRK